MPLDVLTAAIIAVEDNVDILRGAKGDKGETGARGTAGTDGTNGTNGTDGTDGTNGQDGAPGTPGQDGQDGEGITWRGDWTARARYAAQDAVALGGSSYIATAETRTKPPKGPWDLMAQKGADGTSSIRYAGRGGGPGGTGGTGSALTVSDEGTPLDTAVSSLDFTGAGVTASVVGHAVTVDIASGTPITDTFTGDGAQTTFTLSQTATGTWGIAAVNGAQLLPSQFAVSGTSVVFDVAPANLAEVAVTYVFGGGLGGATTGGGLAIYGDGSDGDITVTSDSFTWPDPTGVPSWQPDTAVALGDQVLSTGSNQRIFECVRAGTTGGSDPFQDGDPGEMRRGDRTPDGPVWWEQETAIFAGTIEGPVFADDFDMGGHDLVGSGWIIFARSTMTLDGTLSGAGKPASFIGAMVTSVQSYLGGGVGGGLPDGDTFAGGTPGQENYSVGAFTVWGGGIGGNGGDGAGGSGGIALVPAGLDVGGFTLTRRHILSLMMALYSGTQSIGVGGASGAGDGVSKVGGRGGEAGSAVGVFARTLIFTGAVDCSGGDGGPGEAEGNTGGGGAGSGGCCVFVYDTKSGAGTINVDGGVGGAGQGTGTNGGNAGPGDIVGIANR